MTWPNYANWSSCLVRRITHPDDGEIETRVVACGDLEAPSGRIVCCDPFAMMRHAGNPYVRIPPGRYPVFVTLADVSGKLDGSHLREAYATIVIDDQPEVRRRALMLRQDDSEPEFPPSDDLANAFPVDAGTGCFVDAESLRIGMPAGGNWLEDYFENASADCWFKRMDDPQHIRAGLANIRLPLAPERANIVLFHSGWGDGAYGVAGSFAANGRLIAVHIDFAVLTED